MYGKEIIDELSNYDARSDRLTEYNVKNYIEGARLSLNMWNYFDTFGERPRTINHLEG